VPLRHTVAELEEMVHHVAYEHRGLWAFLHVDITLSATDSHGALKAELMQQARLEAGLIHLRVLTDFLKAKRDTKYPLGLVADDYFDDGWPKRPNVIIGNDTNEQGEILDDLHARLAHLSLRRLDDTTVTRGFSWASVLELAPKVLQRFTRFVEDLSAAHPERAKWFTDQLPSEALYPPR
jgi:hypothetical protein